jgi:hypothetical protein
LHRVLLGTGLISAHSIFFLYLPQSPVNIFGFLASVHQLSGIIASGTSRYYGLFHISKTSRRLTAYPGAWSRTLGCHRLNYRIGIPVAYQKSKAWNLKR